MLPSSETPPRLPGGQAHLLPRGLLLLLPRHPGAGAAIASVGSSGGGGVSASARQRALL